MSKKGASVLLGRLLKTVDRRLTFKAQITALRHQIQWLFDLNRLMELEQKPKPTRQSVSDAVDLYLKNLLNEIQQFGTAEDQAFATQIDKTFRSLWSGLFICYEVEGMPRTNNDLEQFIRRIKTGQRRISGHKYVHDFILRYGSLVAFVDYAETEEELSNRLAKVSQAEFLKERNTLNMIVVKEQKSHRFRYHRKEFLADLENRWEQAVTKCSS
jgi:hypothetical protein